MTRQEFSTLAAGTVLLDGATGSVLLGRGMPRGVSTELWVDRHPEVIRQLQAEYVQAGSQILYAPTFQAQPAPLEKAGYRGSVEALNARLVGLSRQAAGGQALVAGDLSTLAGVMESWNPDCFPQLVEQYRRQIAGLLAGGADLLVGETLLYPQEAEAILTAAELGGGRVPVALTFTMQPDGSLFSGQAAGPVLRELEAAGAAAVGFNCVAAGMLLPGLVAKLRRQVKGPLIAKPNAGNPAISPAGLAEYPMGPEEFAGWQVQAAQLGATWLGGCCGAGPEYIRRLGQRLNQGREKPHERRSCNG